MRGLCTGATTTWTPASQDWFMLAADFDSYTAAQRSVDQVWETPGTWQAMAIRSIANVGWFSSDRTIG